MWQAACRCAGILICTGGGIRKIHISRHRYLWLYQIQEETVYIMAMYHELQDYENCFKNNE